MKYIQFLILFLGMACFLCGCQKEDNVTGYGVGALTVSTSGTKIDSLITITVKNTYPDINRILNVEVKTQAGVTLGNIVLNNGTGSITVSADSLYRYAKMSGGAFVLTSAPRNEIQIENIQFIAKEKKECSKLTTLLIPPAIAWSPYVITKNSAGQDSIKNISNINMQTLEPVYLKYDVTSAAGAKPQTFKITLKTKSGSTTKTINLNYRNFNLSDTLKVIGANYKKDDELTFAIEVQNGKYRDYSEYLTNTSAAQKLGLWSFNGESQNKTLSAATPYFNLFTGQIVTAQAAGTLKFISPDQVQAISSADTTVTIFRYTGEDTYKAYADNDVWKAYDKYNKGVPATAFTGIAKNNGIVAKMSVKKNGTLINETWGLCNVLGVVTTPGSQSINMNYRYSPKKY